MHGSAVPGPAARSEQHQRSLGKALGRAGFTWATAHTFRKTVATQLDDAGLSARPFVDHLGRIRPSLTQDVHLGRGTASPAAAIQRTLWSPGPAAAVAAVRPCRLQEDAGVPVPATWIAG
jgi:hypothetical protein